MNEQEIFGSFGPHPNDSAGSNDQDQDATKSSTPFLSVVIRTQGSREHELQEALLCLAAQTNQDFDLTIIGHNVNAQSRHVVTGSVAQLPDFLQRRTTVHFISGGNRVRPLNYGLRKVLGKYIAFLDDDDLVLAHWVETFRALHSVAPGKVLRSRCATQKFEHTPNIHPRATVHAGEIELPFDAEFSLIRHILSNQTPFMSVAFPLSVFTNFREEFDERLSTNEDWDFLIRTAFVLGVKSSVEVTCIYRVWNDMSTSHDQHSVQEWGENYKLIRKKINGMTFAISEDELDAVDQIFKRGLAALAAYGPDGSAEFGGLTRQELQEEALRLLLSKRWRVAAPFRKLSVWFGRPPAVNVQDVPGASNAELWTMIEALRRSRLFRLRLRALRNQGCRWGLKPPASSSDLAM